MSKYSQTMKESKATLEARARVKKHATKQWTKKQVENMLKGDEVLADKFYVSEVGDLGTIILERHEGSQISFQMMDALASLFGTKRIDIDAVNRETGYCETCADSETVSQVTIYEAVIV